MVFRPATPGFVVTLTATILLAIVSFGVPLIKSVFFLRAQISLDGVKGVATFGVLGFCLDSGSGPNCTSPRIGYEFDPNSLLDNKTPIKIPEVIVKWLTDALVLHIVALVLAAISALFGLLAHIREFATVYCSTFISGLAAAVALIAFIFDIAFFFLTKSRINNIQGASAQIGNAVWLTLAAWLLLFFAGCFYTIGRCCTISRPRGPRIRDPSNDIDTQRSDALRLDAVKAEADRKARQKQKEMGLPAFQEYDSRKPLTLDDDEPYHDSQLSPRSNNNSSYDYFSKPTNQNQNSNYVPAPRGTTAVDSYYASAAAANAATTYPPPPQPPPPQTTYPQSYAGLGTHSQNGTPNPYDSQIRNVTTPGQSLYAPSHTQYASGGQEQYRPPVHSQYPSASASHTQYPSGASDPYAQATTGHSQYGSAGYDPYSHEQYQSNGQYPPNEMPGSYQYNTGAYVTPGADHSQRQSPAPTYQDQTAYAGQYRAPSNDPPTADYKLPPGIVMGQPSMGRDDYTFAPTGYASVALAQNSGYSSQPSASPHGPRSPSSPKAGF